MNPNHDFFENATKTFKKLKAIGIIASIIMIILGACTVISPFGTGMVWLIIAFIAIIIYGISNIVEFCKQPKGRKNGGTLALGILWILIAALFLFSKLDLIPIAESAIIFTIGFIFGFNCIFSGIMAFSTLEYASSKGLAILAGILDLLVGFFVIAAPFFAGITLIWIIGIFVIVMGVSLFVRCLSI